MNNTLISVIMSVYNENIDVLKESIDSILNQSYKNIEFIIVLDNPNNLIVHNLLLAYKRKDKRIKIIVNSENLGLAGSLNKAISTCQGKYIARMDADDISHINRLKIQKEYLDNNIDIAICSTQAKKFGTINKDMRHKYLKYDEINACLIVKNCIIHPTVMFRKNFLDAHHFSYNENFVCAQDYELWTRIAGIGKMAVIDEILLDYRVHNNQITSSKRKLQIQMTKQILKNQLIRAGLNCSNENLRLHMILSKYSPCEEKDLIQLIKWVDYLIDTFRDKKDYKYESLSVILKSQLLNRVLKSNMNIKDKICFLIDYGIVKNFILLKHLIYRIF